MSHPFYCAEVDPATGRVKHVVGFRFHTLGAAGLGLFSGSYPQGKLSHLSRGRDNNFTPAIVTR